MKDVTSVTKWDVFNELSESRHNYEADKKCLEERKIRLI